MAEDYIKALRAGERAYREAVARREYPYIPALDALVRPADVQTEEKMGLMELPLDQVVGTKTAGRQNSVAPNFMPLLSDKSEFAQKWKSLFAYQLEEGVKDPITAYEFLGKYYVLEGNKRVSVFKYLGAYSIEAQVIRIVPKRSENTQVKIFYEYMAFYDKTEINSIWFSKEGGYARLTLCCGKKPDEKWSEDERKDLLSAFNRFSDIFSQSGGGKLPITSADALLTYLQVHSYQGLMQKSDAQLKNEIAAIWKELSLISEKPEDALVMDPADSTSAGVLTRYFEGMSSRDISVAFVHQKPMHSSGWVYGHELGRMYLEQAFNGRIKTTAYFMEGEDSDPLPVIREAADDGNNIIFTTGEGMLPASLKAALENPSVKILNCSVNRPRSAVRTYYGRLYETKFLEGMIAAAMSENGRIAYVSDYPLGGSIANINAFARGAAMVNPRSKVHVSWFYKNGEDLAKLLAEQDIKVVSDLDMIRPSDSSRKYGLYIKNPEGIENLAAPMWNWGAFYEKMLKAVMTGSWKQDQKNHSAVNYWWGISGGIVDLIFSQKLPAGVRTLVELMRREICDGQFHPFGGELAIQGGESIGEAGKNLSPETIITMDVLAANVEGSIPDASVLRPEALKLLESREEFM